MNPSNRYEPTAASHAEGRGPQKSAAPGELVYAGFWRRFGACRVRRRERADSGLGIWSEFLSMLFNKRRRALHEYIAGTVVVRT